MVGGRARGSGRARGGGRGRGRGRGGSDRGPGTFSSAVDHDEIEIDDPGPTSNEREFSPVPSGSELQEPPPNVETTAPNTTATFDQDGQTVRLVPGELIKPETEVRWGDSPWILYGFFQNLTREISR